MTVPLSEFNLSPAAKFLCLVRHAGRVRAWGANVSLQNTIDCKGQRFSISIR